MIPRVVPAQAGLSPLLDRDALAARAPLRSV
jgi:hypothetical protein